MISRRRMPNRLPALTAKHYEIRRAWQPIQVRSPLRKTPPCSNVARCGRIRTQKKSRNILVRLALPALHLATVTKGSFSVGKYFGRWPARFEWRPLILSTKGKRTFHGGRIWHKVALSCLLLCRDWQETVATYL